MDAAARKSFEIQSQVRHNAKTYQSTLKDLQNWEREIKEKENNLQKTPPQEQNENAEGTNSLKSLPVRSHILDKSIASKLQAQHNKQIQQNKGKGNSKTDKNLQNTVKTSNKKPELAPDPDEKNRKEANEIKDAGNRHVKFQQFDLAIEEYTRAINMCPNEAVFYTNRALCSLKLERYSECIEDCDKAIELDKLTVKAYYRRMQANECLGNFMDALKDCTTALTIEPRNAEARKSLDRINERLRRNQKSKKGPNFSPNSENLIEIHPIDKPAYKRSNKPLRRVPIADVIGPKATKTFQNLEISDDDIDKLFNSNCGPFVEVKKTNTPNVEMPPAVPYVDQQATSPSTQVENLTSSVLTESTTTLTDSEEVKEIVNSVKSDTSMKGTNPKEKSTVKPNPKEINKLLSLTSQERVLPAAPTSTPQFYTNWKELPDKLKYQYLSSIKVNNLRKILGAGFDSDTLTDCLRVLHDFYLPNADVTTAATLLEISRNEEIPILSLLMSFEDKKTLSEIIDTLQSKKLINKESLEAIKINFNIV